MLLFDFVITGLVVVVSLQKNLHLETDNSVSNPSRNIITDGLETEFSVLKTLVCDFDRL